LLEATASAPVLENVVWQTNISKAQLQVLINLTPAGDPGPLLPEDRYKLLSEQLLYQMVRAYMQKYGDILKEQVSRAEPDQYQMSAEGIDGGGIPLIFEHFNSKAWRGDSNFPPIDNLEDMASKWKLEMHVKEKPLFFK